jgi:biopolymer transport protein ExbB
MTYRVFLAALIALAGAALISSPPRAMAQETPSEPPAVAPDSAAVPADTAVVAADTAVGQVAVPPGPQEELTVGRAFILKLRQGGLTMVFLLLASVAGVGYSIERFVNLRAGVVVPRGLADKADDLWRAGKWRELEALPEKSNSTLARILSVVARHRHSSMADVSLMAGDVASRDLRRHLQKAYPLAVVATVSPLLGLLGTVIGMIGAFDKVAAAGSLGDASVLGGDISKALITTGAGLTIAVPALVLYHYFKSRTNLYALMLEEEVGELLTGWYSAEPENEATEAGDAG